MNEFEENQFRHLEPIARAATAVSILMDSGPVAEDELCRRLGYQSAHGIRFLMDNLSFAQVPVFEADLGVWDIEV